MYRPYFKPRPQRRNDEDEYYNKMPVSYSNSMRSCEKYSGPYDAPIRKTLIHPYGVPPPIIQPIEYYNPNVPHRQFLNSYTSQEQTYLRKNVSSNNIEHNNVRPQGSFEYSNENWRPQNSSYVEGHRSRTQTEPSFPGKQPWTRNLKRSISVNTVETDDENYLAPKLMRTNSNLKPNSPTSVELLVTNLDQNLDSQDLKNLLLSLFQEHASVVGLSLFQQSDGNLAANVRVSSQQDAQYVISQLHRKKIGHKRIVISHAQTSSPNPQILRSQVIALLQEVPGNKMPLFKFRELLETKYRSSVPVSEFYKLREVCNVSEELGGRMISLCPNLRSASTGHLSPHSGLETPHCLIHCPNGLGEQGWAEQETPSLPNVRIMLKEFSAKVHDMLHSHMGTLPLLSFPVCYELETHEKLPIDETGVPLEHLVTCISGVALQMSSSMVKYLVWDTKIKKKEGTVEEPKQSNSSSMKCVSPPLATQLALFSRELVDLLKTSPKCELPFSRFIPAYHHHFGRQCRVADYGHTKLIDLLAGLTDVVQVIGEGNRRTLTLAHGAQLRRFTSDLLRLLKAQASKHLHKADFTQAYQRLFSRPFDPCDYGLCHLQDLLELLDSQAAVHITHTLIAIPKREQTPQEVLKTKQFTVEVVDLLRHAKQYGILFNKFVPAYHHHFGHQCRVADYGFTKLIDLFEVIPEIVKIEELPNGERTVSLTAKEALKVVKQQITSLVKSSRLQSIPLVALPPTFLLEFGYALRPEIYECDTLEELITKLADALQLISDPAGPMVVITEESVQQQLGIRIWSLLLQPPHKLNLTTILQSFQEKYQYSCSFQQIEKYTYIFEVTTNTNGEIQISLTPRYALAARLYHLLFENNGTILLGNVDGMYLRKYGKVLRPAEFEATNLNILLSQLSFLVLVRGRRNKRNVSLNPNIAGLGISIPSTMKTATMNDGNNNSSYNETWQGPPAKAHSYLFNVAKTTAISPSKADISRYNENWQWPPIPAHTYLFNGARTTPISPPKPDTPPSCGNSEWYDKLWSPSRFVTPPNLRISLPFIKTPPVMGNLRELYSPMKGLLPAFPGTELQVPGLEKGKAASPSRDSGIGCASFCNSMEERDLSLINIESEFTASRYDFFNYM